jgi:hypothetical protein
MCLPVGRHDVHLLGQDQLYLSSGFDGMFIWNNTSTIFPSGVKKIYLHDGRIESFVRLCTNFQHTILYLYLQWQNADLVQISLYQF